GVQTDLTVEQIEAIESTSQVQTAEIHTLMVNLSAHKLDEEALKQDQGLVQFYTGLPNFEVLQAVFDLVRGSVSHTPLNCLSQFEEMMVLFLRLRLNAQMLDLAYRFHVSESTISRIIHRWLDALYQCLQPIIAWPSRKELRETMPMGFRMSFGVDVVVVMDCFELFIDRATSMNPRSLTWSQYKHHNTVKYLIGIAPQGVVTFVSRGWCGRTSDKAVTESCGILDKLVPGDSVLADRGFTIAESVGLRGARLLLPAFTRGQAQLAPWEVERTRKIANVRIHVERVIGLVRNKYPILKATQSFDMLLLRDEDLTVLDQTVFLSAALTNLCDSVVSPD
ncbi:unnamed protein product, partial [Ixodes hexagonus]